MRASFQTALLPTLVTLAIGAFGAAGASALGLPAPYLTGPALAVTVFSISGGRTDMPAWLRDTCFVAIGVNMGAGVTPEALHTASRWPLSLIVLALAVIVILVLGARLMRRIFGFDRMSALLTACPGHLSFVLSLSTDVKADLPRVTMIQSLRVLSLTLIVPFLAPLLGHGDLPVPVARAGAMPMVALLPLLAGSAVLGLGLLRLKVPAALLLGGLGLSALAQGSGVVTGGLPVWMSVPAFVAMGTMIGTRFSGVTLRMFVQALGASLMLTGFAALISLLAAALVSNLLGLPILTALIAFAPGGLETMMAMSLLLNADPAYVAVHHVFRLLVLTAILPIAVARTRAAIARSRQKAP
ncbi:hypothetical protein RGUI_3218 [Rhodovulum sp. P5]|uniref:AbrB family transcriptional regulator n=1 Tax=Rhodovulum sp. P5 TaxID=1564506 RepID=UPI0009C37020|nr:AbrB family transcriptional regulator [Rhodovulum sp. P5]ARE41359.1 hypothetical protein RGUI_3218 [Rhodovulum sp. P5]